MQGPAFKAGSDDRVTAISVAHALAPRMRQRTRGKEEIGHGLVFARGLRQREAGETPLVGGAGQQAHAREQPTRWQKPRPVVLGIQPIGRRWDWRAGTPIVATAWYAHVAAPKGSASRAAFAGIEQHSPRML